jgi:hypothetical protein
VCSLSQHDIIERRDVESLRRGVFRWRHAVLAGEALVALTFAVLGWRLLHQPGRAAVVELGPPPVAAATASPGLVLPLLDPLIPPAATHAPRPELSNELLARLNADAVSLYQEQWRAVQILTDGIRRYLERRVLPSLLDPGMRG